MSIEPFYNQQDIALYQGDCLEVMPHLLQEVQAVVTDPPYGINQHRGGERATNWKSVPRIAIAGDEKLFDPSPFLGFPTVCLFGANHFAAALPNSPAWLIWDKREAGTSDSYADVEMAWTNADIPARLFHHKWRGMIKASEKDQQRVHPTQKPVVLMMWVLDVLEIPRGAVVFDPFMGSGTTGVACVNTGRKFIGIEQKPEYCATAQRRIVEALAQPRLTFDAAPTVTIRQEAMFAEENAA